MIDADFEQVEETKGDLIVLDPKPQYKNKMEEVIDEADEANKKAIFGAVVSTPEEDIDLEDE